MKISLMAMNITPYMDFNLKVMGSRNEIYTLIGIKEEICFLSGLTYPCDISDIKPILRPMADVLKPYIDDAGKSFIPAELLWSVDANEEDAFHTYGKVPEYWKDSLAVNINSHDYRTVNLLLEMHFDVFGLIAEGLAIDFNTLKALKQP